MRYAHDAYAEGEEKARKIQVDLSHQVKPTHLIASYVEYESRPS